jgi:hypothetical protein
MRSALGYAGLTVPELAEKIAETTEKGYGAKTLYNMLKGYRGRLIQPHDGQIIAVACGLAPDFFETGQIVPAPVTVSGDALEARLRKIEADIDALRDQAVTAEGIEAVMARAVAGLGRASARGQQPDAPRPADKRRPRGA